MAALRGASSMAEQWTFNPWVQGSSPWRPTVLKTVPGPPPSRGGSAEAALDGSLTCAAAN